MWVGAAGANAGMTDHPLGSNSLPHGGAKPDVWEGSGWQWHSGCVYEDRGVVAQAMPCVRRGGHGLDWVVLLGWCSGIADE